MRCGVDRLVYRQVVVNIVGGGVGRVVVVRLVHSRRFGMKE